MEEQLLKTSDRRDEEREEVVLREEKNPKGMGCLILICKLSKSGRKKSSGRIEKSWQI